MRHGKTKFLHDRQEELHALWWSGKNDYQIAAIVGCTPSNICQWRKKNELPPNGQPGRPRKGGIVCRG